MHSFTKFPSTPHLAGLPGASVRDDKVLSHSERDLFLTHEVTIEEKIDGANLGISFDDAGNIQAQNRGNLLQEPMSGQWKSFPEWLALRGDRFFEVLTDRYILFGEWCYAKHSISYDCLPDWFIGFDIYDCQASRFVSKARRDGLLAKLEVDAIACLASGRFSFAEINGYLGTSRYGQTEAEGLYLRYDDGDWLGQRAKLVRSDFIQSIDTHWSRGPLEVNRLAAQQETGR